MTRHRFINEGVSPIPMEAGAEFACVCGKRGSRDTIAEHIVESSSHDVDPQNVTGRYATVDESADFGGGNTKANYLPIAPRKPAPPSTPPTFGETDAQTPPDLPPLPTPGELCPLCQAGEIVVDLPEIAAWSCAHWIRKKPRPIAEAFQDMLRRAYQAGIVAAASGETFESWYQREVLQ